MAQRTITSAGGTFSLTSTWVEGAVPGSGDHIVGLATSGPLILTDSRTVQRADFTEYQNLLTLTSSGQLTFGTIGTTTFSATMSFLFNNITTYVGSNQLSFSSNHSIQQLGTQIIPRLRFFGSSTRTLLSDLYVRNMNYTSNNNITNGFNIYIYGDLANQSGGTENDGFAGTTIHLLNGFGFTNILVGHSGFLSATSSIIINGTYSSFGGPLRLNSLSDLTIATTSNCSNLIVYLEDILVNNDSYNLTTFSSLNNLIIETTANNSAIPLRNINILSPKLIVDNVMSYNIFRTFTSDDVISQLRFLGGGLSASTFYTNGTMRLPSSGSYPYNFLFRSNDIALDPGFTHSIGNLYLQGVEGNKSFFTASSAGTVNLVVSGTNSSIANYDFTNINASGGQKLYALNGVLTNTTNIQNTIPTGGTGGTGSVAGPYAFATIN